MQQQQQIVRRFARPSLKNVGSAVRTQLCCSLSPSARALSTENAPKSPPVPNQLLSGMLVIELANVLAGPSVGQFAAELGATVIKVESTRTKGDVTRSWTLADEQASDGISAYFTTCNSGKQSIALNLKDPRGVDVLHKLAAKADVVIASYKPGDAKKLHADAETLQAINPSLIYGHISGYGENDPRAGYDAVIQAETGFESITGDPGGGSLRIPVPITDELASHQLKQGILVALWEREKFPDHGPHRINVSLFQAGVSALANQASAYLNLGAVPVRMGSDHPSICPYGTIFQCKYDKGITLAVGSDAQFVKLCDILELSHLPKDARFTTNPARVVNRKVLLKELSDTINAWTREDLLARLATSKVPAGPVNNLAEAFAIPPAAALEMPFPLQSNSKKIDMLTHCTGLRQTVFTDEQAPDMLPPPKYGEHTVHVLQEFAGLSEQQIKDLTEAKVVDVGN